MNKLHLCSVSILFVLFLIFPAFGQQSVLGVKDGDSFTFVIDEYDGTHFQSNPTNISKGDKFTVKVINATIGPNYKADDGSYEDGILIETNPPWLSEPTQFYQPLWFGEMITYLNWDSYRNQIPQPQLIENDQQFGLEDIRHETQTYSKYTYQVDSKLSFIYSKDDGVFVRYHYSWEQSNTYDNGTKVNSFFAIQYSREGFESGSSRINFTTPYFLLGLVTIFYVRFKKT